jgi:hypothetical protein
VRPHFVQGSERRSRSLDASGAHLMINGKRINAVRAGASYTRPR